jgi:hypothetical protein
MLTDFVGDRTEGLLFRSSTGAQLLQSNALSDSLHPTLKAIQHVTGGFNIFRRLRITRLQKTECPEVLRHFWSGHAPRHVSERYTTLRGERDFRLGWAEKVGLGFELPLPIGQLGQPRLVLKVAEVIEKMVDERGIRTPGLLVANDVNSRLRRGAAIA